MDLTGLCGKFVFCSELCCLSFTDYEEIIDQMIFIVWICHCLDFSNNFCFFLFSPCKDPYVKIYLFHNQERISKKRTHIKRRTLSPVFNESFIFDIPSDECLDNIHLKFLIYDHDRVTRNEFIGKVEIGSKTGIPSTEKHWHEVIKSPRRQIAEWHRLTDDNNNSGGGDK